MSKESIEDLVTFLADERVDLRSKASATVAKLTGTSDGLRLIVEEKQLLVSNFKLINDSNVAVAENSWNTLTNISSEEVGATALLAVKEVDVVKTLVDCVQNPDHIHADFACGVLANLTHFSDLCSRVLTELQNLPLRLEGLVFILCQVGHNKKGANLDLLASVISNFSQSSEGRREILNKEKCIFERLLAFIDYSGSKVRRKAVISVVHNCCFEKDYHAWFLSEDIDVASRLALPLAAADNFTDDENDSLPLDLQYLPEDKTREEDPELRLLLLEAFMQLCSTRKSRVTLRDLNIYLILREHHKWEKEERCSLLNEDVVNLLIKTEEEIGEEDLTAVEVPSDIARKFSDFDAQMVSAVTEEEPTTK